VGEIPWRTDRALRNGTSNRLPLQVTHRTSPACLASFWMSSQNSSSIWASSSRSPDTYRSAARTGKWVRELKRTSYGPDGYPFTGLGYTND